ncbi:MAG: alpha-amylase, partial [Paludibacteraceae bacterium]|nr:alpha-amylase [Paludibacteraceae bacterium]
LYDKVGMYEYLRGVVSKSWSADGITQHWLATDDIRDHMLYFLENHDEQRIGSGFFCGSGIYAKPAMIVAATLGTNPVMIYAGQELDEKGMDVEGFSGMDGRTTIFDYWGVRSLQAWGNNGKFDGKLLTDEQKALRKFYGKLLTIARDNPAINSGRMYDLMYAQSDTFNRHSHYTFLRKEGDELLLVVVNFDDKKADIDVRIPEDAFRYLEQPELKKVAAVDLLSDKKVKIPVLNAETPVHLTLSAWEGAIIRITNAEKKRK